MPEIGQLRLTRRAARLNMLSMNDAENNERENTMSKRLTKKVAKEALKLLVFNYRSLTAEGKTIADARIAELERFLGYPAGYFTGATP